MDIVIRLIAAFGFVATLIHIISAILALSRCRPGRHSMRAAVHSPGVTLVRPVCGVDRFETETLRSSFTLDYRPYEIIFCVADAHDPVVPLIERLMARH